MTRPEARRLKYPSWICRDCGDKWGRGFPHGHCATWHPGKCGICGDECAVTEPRDYGHLIDGWQQNKPAPRAGKGRSK